MKHSLRNKCEPLNPEFQLNERHRPLVAGQLIDLMLPPNKVSFYVWAYLFTEYCRGAYYPERHFNHVITSLVHFIDAGGGALVNNEQVVGFIMDGRKVIGAYTQQVDPKTGVIKPGPRKEYFGKQVICNFDPKIAATMIGREKFSRRVQKQLNYDYSYSNLVFYVIIDKLDLKDYGFGKWNIWHTEEPDLNTAFESMYTHNDYSKPYFAMNCRSLHTSDTSDCPEGKQIFQVATVANYAYWKDLKLRSLNEYNAKKKEVYNQIMAIVERDYVPDLCQKIPSQRRLRPGLRMAFLRSPFPRLKPPSQS